MSRMTDPAKAAFRDFHELVRLWIDARQAQNQFQMQVDPRLYQRLQHEITQAAADVLAIPQT